MQDNKTHRAIILVFVAFVSGCAPWALLYEPYPCWKVEEIEQSAVPSVVIMKFRNDYQDVKNIKIERSTFMSAGQGYPKEYKFTFADSCGTMKSVIYDGKGNRSTKDFWFSVPKEPRSSNLSTPAGVPLTPR